MSAELGFDVLTLPRAVQLAYMIALPGIKAGREREAALARGERPAPDRWLAWLLAEGVGREEAERQAADYSFELLRTEAPDG